MDSKILDRVRGLLNKAESTEFEAEAETLRAKAEQLIAMYSIERALLAGVDRGKVTSVKIEFEDPFSSEKRFLLDAVATALGCVCVGHRHTDRYGYKIRGSKGYASATIVGYSDELEQVELLYTSLLVQSARAVARVSSGQPGRSGAARTRSMRSSFLLGFAARSEERLTEIYRKAVQEAVDGEPGKALVLVDRKAAVDAKVSELFTKLTRSGSRTYWPGDYEAGARAADRADMGQDRFGTRRRALPQRG